MVDIIPKVTSVVPYNPRGARESQCTVPKDTCKKTLLRFPRATSLTRRFVGTNREKGMVVEFALPRLSRGPGGEGSETEKWSYDN